MIDAPTDHEHAQHLVFRADRRGGDGASGLTGAQACQRFTRQRQRLARLHEQGRHPVVPWAAELEPRHRRHVLGGARHERRLRAFARRLFHEHQPAEIGLAGQHGAVHQTREELSEVGQRCDRLAQAREHRQLADPLLELLIGGGQPLAELIAIALEVQLLERAVERVDELCLAHRTDQIIAGAEPEGPQELRLGSALWREHDRVRHDAAAAHPGQQVVAGDARKVQAGEDDVRLMFERQFKRFMAVASREQGVAHRPEHLVGDGLQRSRIPLRHQNAFQRFRHAGTIARLIMEGSVCNGLPCACRSPDRCEDADAAEPFSPSARSVSIRRQGVFMMLNLFGRGLCGSFRAWNESDALALTPIRVLRRG